MDDYPLVISWEICKIGIGQHRIMGQGDSASVLAQAKVRKMREYWMYFPFFVLRAWGKRSAEARSPHLSGVAIAKKKSGLLPSRRRSWFLFAICGYLVWALMYCTFCMWPAETRLFLTLFTISTRHTFLNMKQVYDAYTHDNTVIVDFTELDILCLY